MKPGQLIADRYEVRQLLGRGGMGEVYLGYDQRLATDVALKRVPLELSLEPAVRAALIGEARILARLSDNHIVRLFDLADTADGMFLVLEYVCGPSLDQVLAARKTITVEELRHVIDHVALGLTRAHSLAVIHRDLKPSNLLVALSGDERRYYLRDGTIPATLLNSEIKVTDFGLAKVIRQSQVELSHSTSGTPAFMAPEQFRGELPSIETDIYALGFVAYVCLAGDVPIGDAEPVYFHLYVTPPPIRSVPPHVNAAIQRAIRKDRADRFRSAADFAGALRNPDLIQPYIPPAPQPVRDPTPVIDLQRRHRITPQPDPTRQGTVPDNGTQNNNTNNGGNNKKILFFMLSGIGVVVLVVVLLVVMAFNYLKARMTSTIAGSPTVNSQPAHLPPVGTGSEMALSSGLAELAPLNPAPRIDELPPVIEQSRRPASPVRFGQGIDHPAILARARVTGREVFGLGPDGTIYLTNNKTDIGAFRNGQLVWQYKLGQDIATFYITNDGLIWIDAGASDKRLYCFNSAGQGGEIANPAAKAKYIAMVTSQQPPAPEAQCVDDPSPGIDLYQARGMKLWHAALDFRCSQSAIVGSSGKVLVQTQSRALYLLSNQGKTLWSYPSTCPFDYIFLLSNDTAIGLCSGRKKLIGVRDGQQSFAIQGNETISEPFGQDRDNNFYRFADTDVYDRHLLIKTNTDGRDVWTLPIGIPIRPDAVLSPDGKIYLLNMSPAGSYIVVIGESR